MKFIKLNYKKLLLNCGFIVVIWGVIFVLIFLYKKGQMSTDDYLLSTLVVAGFYVIIILAGFFSFYRNARLLGRIARLKLFDNDNSYVVSTMAESSFLGYNVENLNGSISGYPVSLYVFTSIDNRLRKNAIVLSLIDEKGINTDDQLRLEFDEWGVPPKDIKNKIVEFIASHRGFKTR